MKKRGLGRGVDALFSELRSADDPTVGEGLRELIGEEGEGKPTPPAKTGLSIQEIPLQKIDPNREQPRKRFDEDALQALSASIKSVGVIQPIVVAEKEGRYQIIAGERRWRAARLAGLSAVPCIVRKTDTMQRLQLALIENLQRENLNPIELAAALQALITECALTQETVGDTLGMDRSTVSNALRLLNLTPEVRKMVEQGRLSAGHARALVSVDDFYRQIEMARKVDKEGYSVRQTEALVKAWKEGRTLSPRAKSPLAPELARVTTMARQRFGVKVDAKGDGAKGRIVLIYQSQEELNRLYEALGGEDS